jgi:hypothetical protein
MGEDLVRDGVSGEETHVVPAGVLPAEPAKPRFVCPQFPEPLPRLRGRDGHAPSAPILDPSRDHEAHRPIAPDLDVRVETVRAAQSLSFELRPLPVDLPPEQPQRELVVERPGRGSATQPEANLLRVRQPRLQDHEHPGSGGQGRKHGRGRVVGPVPASKPVLHLLLQVALHVSRDHQDGRPGVEHLLGPALGGVTVQRGHLRHGELRLATGGAEQGLPEAPVVLVGLRGGGDAREGGLRRSRRAPGQHAFPQHGQEVRQVSRGAPELEGAAVVGPPAGGVGADPSWPLVGPRLPRPREPVSQRRRRGGQPAAADSQHHSDQPGPGLRSAQHLESVRGLDPRKNKPGFVPEAKQGTGSRGGRGAGRGCPKGLGVGAHRC